MSVFDIEKKDAKGTFQKYSDLLSKYLIREGGRERVLALLQELLLHMNEVCETCQQDRIRCALKPLCGPSRPFLITRIELGFKSEELPQFCLKQYLNYIKNFLTGKIKYVELKDIKLTLGQFFSLLQEIRPIPVYIPPRDQPDELIKVLFDTVKKTLDNVLVFKGKDHSYLWMLNTLIHIDMTSRIITINPTDDPITSEEELKQAIITLSTIYDIPVEIIEEMYGFWYINFFIKKIKTKRILTKEELETLRISREKLEQHTDYAVYNIREQKIHALVDIASPGRNPKGKRLTMGTLRKIFDIIKETRTKLDLVGKQK
ncbi:MAG: hypothetical protein ACTSQY_01810 [Candidatus Odinarchaeia archaeon]